MGERTRLWLRGLALDSREGRAWALYDWANSAFMTVVITAVFPLFFLTVCEGLFDSTLAEKRFTAATTISLVFIAVIAPMFGTLADARGAKKRFLTYFSLTGMAATAGMFFIQPGDWLLALTLFGVANVGVAGSIIFYDSLLPHVARKGELDQLSTSGYALGYVGGGVILAMALVLINRPEWFGVTGGDATLPTRIAFVGVAVWWFVFTIPLWRRVPEPAPSGNGSELRRTLLGSIKQLRETLRDLRRFPQAALMLLAFLIYNDGIATIMRMAGIYAKANELEDSVVIGTILMIQFLGIPFAMLFGRLSKRFGTKPMILVGVFIYSIISILAYFMSTSLHFVALGVLVAVVQGGTQGLSRSLFASMIPSHKSGEFFSFFAVGEKFAGILGPALYGLVIHFSGSSQNAMISIAFFFVAGGLLLLKVDPEEGRRQARAAELEIPSR